MTRTTHQPEALPGNVNDVLDALEMLVGVNGGRRGWPEATVVINPTNPNVLVSYPLSESAARVVKHARAVLKRWGR